MALYWGLRYGLYGASLMAYNAGFAKGLFKTPLRAFIETPLRAFIETPLRALKPLRLLLKRR